MRPGRGYVVGMSYLEDLHPVPASSSPHIPTYGTLRHLMRCKTKGKHVSSTRRFVLAALSSTNQEESGIFVDTRCEVFVKQILETPAKVENI